MLRESFRLVPFELEVGLSTTERRTVHGVISLSARPRVVELDELDIRPLVARVDRLDLSELGKALVHLLLRDAVRLPRGRVANQDRERALAFVAITALREVSIPRERVMDVDRTARNGEAVHPVFRHHGRARVVVSDERHGAFLDQVEERPDVTNLGKRSLDNLGRQSELQVPHKEGPAWPLAVDALPNHFRLVALLTGFSSVCESSDRIAEFHALET